MRNKDSIVERTAIKDEAGRFASKLVKLGENRMLVLDKDSNGCTMDA